MAGKTLAPGWSTESRGYNTGRGTTFGAGPAKPAGPFGWTQIMLDISGFLTSSEFLFTLAAAITRLLTDFLLGLFFGG